MADLNWEYNLEITKAFTDENGALIIAGEASNEFKDEDDEILDQASLKACFETYMKNPVVKFMHDKTPQWKGAIGRVIYKAKDSKGEEVVTSFGETPFLVIKLLDGLPGWMINAVQDRIYKGLSIGGKLEKKVGDRLIMKAWLETSVVDIPAAKGCFFTVLKAAGQEKEDNKESLEKSSAELAEACAKLCERVNTFKAFDSLPNWITKGCGAEEEETEEEKKKRLEKEKMEKE
ncbi:MAG: hypothetical protein WC175_01775 [Candidatus Dojkabacteria bacterium]|jgi:hypothetical protein